MKSAAPSKACSPSKHGIVSTMRKGGPVPPFFMRETAGGGHGEA
jgi:hypothetical protein